MSVPTIEYGAHHPEDGRPGVFLRTPYDSVFVEELKSALPWRDRAWLPSEGVWWVSDRHRQYAQGLLLDRWPEIMVVGAEGGDYLLDRDGVITKQFGLFDG